MKMTFRALLFVLCLNLSVLIVEATMGPLSIPTTLDTGQAIESMNATEVVDSWSWTEDQGLYGDVQFGLLTFWNTAKTIVMGFPTLLSTAGVPSILSSSLTVIWSFIWVTFVVEVLTGRNITGE